MTWCPSHLNDAVRIVEDAGGTLVGRTRLQKVAYLAQLAGFGIGFDFEYRHYGPYSEDLATSIEIAAGLGLVSEEERRAEWGGKYSIYRTNGVGRPAPDQDRSSFIMAAAQIDAVQLELAATAAFLFAEEGIGRMGGGDPWEETARRKPEKAADGRLVRARRAYQNLRKLPVPRVLPEI